MAAPPPVPSLEPLPATQILLAVFGVTGVTPLVSLENRRNHRRNRPVTGVTPLVSLENRRNKQASTSPATYPVTCRATYPALKTGNDLSCDL